MSERVDYKTASPHAFKAMAGLQAVVNHSGLEPALLELIKLRASQINGCAFCIDMHFREGREQGLSDEQLYMLDAWREAPVYTARERAALAWTDAITLVAQSRAPDETYERALAEFGDEQLANLTLAIVAINGWNRFGVGFRLPPLGPRPHHG